MKKYLIIAIILIILALGVILLLKPFKSNNNSNEEKNTFTSALEKNKIRIGKTYWAGEKDFKKPEPEISEYDITLNKKIKFDGDMGDLEIEITEINYDNIKIRTNIAMSERKDGRISLLSDQKEFIIENRKMKEIATPTTDAGDIYMIYINI